MPVVLSFKNWGEDLVPVYRAPIEGQELDALRLYSLRAEYARERDVFLSLEAKPKLALC